MKSDIHPKYHSIKVKCACGTEFEVGSTLYDDNLSVEICSNCHPFYTGQQKVVKTKRVEQFRKRYEAKPAKNALPTKPVEEKKAAAKKPTAVKKEKEIKKATKKTKKSASVEKEKTKKVAVKKKK